MKRSICIISFSPIDRDARVLRQIKYLSNYYDLNVIGYGVPQRSWENVQNIRWHVIREPKSSGAVKFMEAIYLALGRLKPSFYDHWYWRKVHHRFALKMAIANKCDAYHANDWEALPVAAEAAKKFNAQLVFDSHEYAPLELENRFYWKLLFQPAIIFFINKYKSHIDTSVTVAPLISERYKQEFGLKIEVILNAPEIGPSLPFRELDIQNIKLVHHGAAIRDRQLETLIECLALCDRRYSLHFMLVNNDSDYLNHLKKLANQRTPGRVTFHQPVPPDEIVQRISEYDIGFCFIAPTNYNYLVSLPNKFFDYVMAGLAVCIGPSPSMMDLVNKYGFGVVAPSFDPCEISKTLNKLTLDQLSMMRIASRKAAAELNAEKEMEKLVDLYHQLLNDQQKY